MDNDNSQTREKTSRRSFLKKSGQLALAAAAGVSGASLLLAEEVPPVNAAPVTGSGTVGKIPKWVGSTQIGNSVLSESGGGISLLGTITSGGTKSASQGNVTGNRALNTVYQNATGKNLFLNILVHVNNTGGASTASADLFVDSVNPPNVPVALCHTNSAIAISGTLAAIVPSGYYYRVTTNGAPVLLLFWIETTF